jgi:demethylmenaquinone methyltransferase/2-methoxy-6-polyprenyl-1,4-benzoquinol methylase
MNRHFDLIARFYDRVIGEPDLDRLSGYLELEPTISLLDAGGGTGRVSGHLQACCRRVVVSDLSRPMLARARLKEGLLPVAAHAERLPFADRTFERIVVVDALHHFCDREDALADLQRVLAPDGLMVIEEPDIGRFAVRLLALAEKLALMGSRFLRGERIAGILEKHGLSVRIERAGHVMWIIAQKGPDA